MATSIQRAVFYFAIPQQDSSGNILIDSQTEQRSILWSALLTGTKITLSTAEVLFAKASSDGTMVVTNTSYFGEGKFGSLLAIQYIYADGTDKWIQSIVERDPSSEHMDMLIGSWVKGLSYKEILDSEKYSGYPCIGYAGSSITLKVGDILESDRLSLEPSTVTIRLGDVATFTAMHPYTGNGVWTHSTSLAVVQKTSKTIKLKPASVGTYEIKYTINNLVKESKLYVQPKTTKEGDYEEPEEPLPPSLPDTPPSVEKTADEIALLEPRPVVQPLYKYPNIMKRNARYRGQRESEKFLSDHQEQIFDIRQLTNDIQNLQESSNTMIYSWFNGDEGGSISMKTEGNEKESNESLLIQNDTLSDTVRAFSGDVLELSINTLENQMVGIYDLKERMQRLDERLAEAERRYTEYENAYE